MFQVDDGDHQQQVLVSTGRQEAAGKKVKPRANHEWEGPPHQLVTYYSPMHLPLFFSHKTIFQEKTRLSSRFCSLSSSVPTGPVTPSCGSALNRTTGGFAPNQTQDTGADGQRRILIPHLFQPNDNFRPTNFLFKDPFPYRMQTC